MGTYVRLAAFIFCLIGPGFVRAQSVKGTVRDSLKQPLPFATIAIRDSDVILSYAEADKDGSFVMDKPAGAKLVIEASLIGYRKQQLPLSDAKSYSFFLRPTLNQLKTIIIKDSRPQVKMQGDTLSYRAASFSNPQDRVIGDVIKRLPGIDVSSDGKISYNGKPISNLYIDGDNLLDDKYSIATRSIPHSVVDAIQVIEHDQPIKMLRGSVVSKNVALNLTIKPDAKVQVVGQETLGGGIPANYYADLNAMLFKKRFKAINYLDANNSSNDLQADVISHNMVEYANRTSHDKPGALLSLGTVGNPDIPSSRYLRNQSQIFNINNLVNLKNDRQLKVNAYYLHDITKQDYTSQTTVYLLADTIKYTEIQHNQKNSDLIHAQLGYLANKEHYYLKNNLQFDGSIIGSQSDLSGTTALLHQSLTDNTYDLSNEFNLLKSMGSGDILEVYSYIGAFKQPEQRIISPGILPTVFNYGAAYQRLVQTLNSPLIDINSYLSYKLPLATIKQAYKAGLAYRAQQLNSALATDDHLTQLLDSGLNHTAFHQDRAYTEANYSYMGSKVKGDVTLPLNYQTIRYSDGSYQFKNTLSKFYMAPQVYLRYEPSDNNHFFATYSFNNSFGNIRDIYKGYILTDYRTLQANDAPLLVNSISNAGMGYNFRKTVELLFFSINFNYTHTHSISIKSSIISNTFSRLIALPFPNSTNQYMINARLSKYLFSLHSTVGISTAWQKNYSTQILNNALLPYVSTTPSATLTVDSKISDKVSLNYKGTMLHMDNHPGDKSGYSVVKQFQQQVNCNYSQSENLLFSAASDYRYTSQTGLNNFGYHFIDLLARYNFKRTKLDLELAATNILNVKNYQTVSTNINTFRSNSYLLPGRIVLLKASFRL